MHFSSPSTEGALSLPQELERSLLRLSFWLFPPSRLLLLSLHSSGGPCFSEGSLRGGGGFWRAFRGVSYPSNLSRLGVWCSSLCLGDREELHLEVQGHAADDLCSGLDVDWSDGGGDGGGAEGGGDVGGLAAEPYSSLPPWLLASRLPVHEEKLPEYEDWLPAAIPIPLSNELCRPLSLSPRGWSRVEDGRGPEPPDAAAWRR